MNVLEELEEAKAVKDYNKCILEKWLMVKL